MKLARMTKARRLHPLAVTTPGTPLTKEFLVNMMETFKAEMFNEFKIHNKEFIEFKTSLTYLSEKMDEATARELYSIIKNENSALKLENKRISQEMKEMKRWSNTPGGAIWK